MNIYVTGVYCVKYLNFFFFFCNFNSVFSSLLQALLTSIEQRLHHTHEPIPGDLGSPPLPALLVL